MNNNNVNGWVNGGRLDFSNGVPENSPNQQYYNYSNMNGGAPGSSHSHNQPNGLNKHNYNHSSRTDIPPNQQLNGWGTKDQSNSKNPRLHQNAEAVVRNISKKKDMLREGKHAAAIDQLHENDLHGIEAFNRKPEGRNPSRIEPQQKHGKINLHQRPRVRQPASYEDTELTTSFDPMKDRHLWAMWRTAVNGRIVDAVRKLESKRDSAGGFDQSAIGPHNGGRHGEPSRGVYGPSIVAPPLKRFIKLQDGSKEIAHHLSNEGRGQLHASQFVFYGLPRVYMERGPANNGPPK